MEMRFSRLAEDGSIALLQCLMAVYRKQFFCRILSSG